MFLNMRPIVAVDCCSFYRHFAIIGASGAKMKVGIAFLASVVLSGNAIAASVQYDVDGLAIGTQLNFSSALREYKCSPSEQFGGLTWCQKTRTFTERRKTHTAAYSLLHSQDGKIVYVNRSQESIFSKSNEAEEDIQRYSRKLGESPRIMKMPRRSGLADGLIAVWGQITLVQLDEESVKSLSEGRRPKKGLLIDFLGNFVRSAKEGLPIYSIGGGPGLVWAATFNQKGHGTLRLAAVDASGFLMPEPQPTSELKARPEPQPVSQPTGDQTEEKLEDQLALRQKVEGLQRELATATATIAELEKDKAAAEVARVAADEARIAAEAATSEIEQARATEKAKLDERIAQLEADGVATGKSRFWQDALYGSMGGLLVVLISFASGFVLKRQKPQNSPTEPIDVSVQSQSSIAQAEPYVLSPAITIEDAFGRELEQQVAAVNEMQSESDGEHRSHAASQESRSDEPDTAPSAA